MGFEHENPGFERVKTVHALLADRAATVFGRYILAYVEMRTIKIVNRKEFR
jgi:hypothetical protein